MNTFKESITGARNKKTFFAMIFFFFAGLAFFLIGLSSFFGKNFFLLTDTSEIHFFPQGIIMLFYGSLSLGFFFYLFCTFLWNVGSGYNEFLEKEKIIHIVRTGFPGKNRNIFLSYEFQRIQGIKFFFKKGINPRANILLVLKDKREIPLYPAQFFLNPIQIEKTALFLGELLNLPVENIIF